MFEASADLYDLIYLAWKDYAREAERLAEWIRARRPGATRILDVACGTGEHARHLGRLGFEVDGVDLSEPFVRIAQALRGAVRTSEPEGGAFRRALEAVEVTTRPVSAGRQGYTVKGSEGPDEAVLAG